MWSKSLRLAGGGLLLALAIGLAACYPEGPEDLGDIGLVLTIDNPEGDYTGMQTYAMPDTVLPLINPDDGSSEPLNRTFDALILETIAAEMAARGFTRVDPDTMESFPDVVVQVGGAQRDAYLVFTYWGYPGYGWPGYGWGYPTTGVYQFQQGSLLWNMTDYRNVDPDNPDDIVPVLWVAGINGAITGTGTNPEVGIPTGIRQGFAQSTYIKASTAGR